MISEKNGLSILIIPGIVPYPPDNGGKLCVFGLIDYLRSSNFIQVLLFAGNLQDKKNIEDLMREWPNVTIHYVAQYEKETPLSTKHKILNLFKKSMKGFYALLRKLALKDNLNLDAYAKYDAYNSMPFYPQPEFFIKKLVEIISNNKFDIIQTETTPMLNLVNLFPDNAKKLFVQIESRSDILFDYGNANNFDPSYIKYAAGNTQFLEYSYMNQYDAILALNESDKLKLIQQLSSKVKVYSSPYGILDKDLKKLNSDTYQAENLIFIGSEGHYPNFDGLKWFLTDIIPRFKHRPFKKLYVTGVWDEKTKKRFSKLLNNVDFIGFVDDLSPYLNNSVCIVPIRIGGGGIRTKILTAMIMGAPVVSTSVAVVGIKGAHQKELLIEDVADNFASTINSLFNNNELACTIRMNAYQLIINEYSQSKVGAIRDNIYREISST